MADPDKPLATHSRQGLFVTTHWSEVLAAAEGGGSPASFDALSRLCQVYWYPLYAYVRRRGHDGESAADLTQGFYAELLAKKSGGKTTRAVVMTVAK